MFCGYILALLGAEVIAVEPPGGSPSRRLAPFAGDSGDPEDGLWWQAYARGKKNLILDLTSSADHARFMDLAADADFVIESFTADQVGVDYDALAAVNPGVIVVSISAFGRTGPKAAWPATDLTIWAASGAHILAGDDDRAPVRTSVPQSFLHAGADAAGAALIALQARHKSGLGQHVDVSAQQSSAQAALSAMLAEPNNAGITTQRIAGGVAGLGFPIQLTWPCRDGYVAITLLFGPAFTEPNRRLLSWLQEYGACTVEDVETDWGLELAAMSRGERSAEAYFELCAKIESFTRERSQQELFDEGLERGLYIAPTLDIAGVLEEPQFEARGFWSEIENISEVPIRVPGPFAKFSASPLVDPLPAPRLEDAGEDDGPSRRPALQGSMDAATSDSLPLAGLKVLDFMWVIAGPFFTRVLSDYGATVVKVESSTVLEPARGAPPFRDGEPGIENGMPFANFNAGKLGVTIDPANPVGREVILDLVRWADVVTESFSPKAMKAWGLDYAALREINPSLVMLSSCLMGQTGPRAQVPGYGNMAAALTGFYDLTGWPDRSPAGPYLAYTDGVSPRFMLVALLAALEHLEHTGQGQYIDVSQAEAAIHMLAPAILEHEVNSRIWSRTGNHDLDLCPHGVYPALGEDRWVAIACQSDEAWRALCTTMGFEDAHTDESLSMAAGRRDRADVLDRMIAEWTGSRAEGEIESVLITAGVAAHVVQNSAECVADPQLRHRGHFQSVAHPSLGQVVVEGTRFALSRTPARVTRAAPELGEHNAYVLQDILGYDAERIADVFASMAME